MFVGVDYHPPSPKRLHASTPPSNQGASTSTGEEACRRASSVDAGTISDIFVRLSSKGWRVVIIPSSDPGQYGCLTGRRRDVMVPSPNPSRKSVFNGSNSILERYRTKGYI